MLETTPFHKENYSRLIIGVIVQYYQQCSARFRGEQNDCFSSRSETSCLYIHPELVSLSQSPDSLGEVLLATPALWSQGEDSIQILTEMRSVVVSRYKLPKVNLTNTLARRPP